MILTIGKTGLCFCKNDYYNTDGVIIFEKYKIYDFIVDDDKTIWITYNKNGNILNSGRRFNTNESAHLYSFLPFYDNYFCENRKEKLNKLNKIYESNN